MASNKKTTNSAKPILTVDSRTQLIDVALRIIMEQGIDAVRIENIVAEVGVTKGSLYWHFDDREGLIKAALAEHIRRESEITVAGVVDALDESSGKDDYFSRIAPYLADPYNVEQVRERWSRLAILVETRKHPELVEMMRDVQARNLEVFVELMTEAQNSGVLRQDLDPRAVAVALNAMYLGSNIIDVLGESGPTPDAWWNLISFFIGALFPPDTSVKNLP